MSLALDALHSAEEQVKVSKEGLELAENELAQARRRYEAGVASAWKSPTRRAAWSGRATTRRRRSTTTIWPDRPGAGDGRSAQERGMRTDL